MKTTQRIEGAIKSIELIVKQEGKQYSINVSSLAADMEEAPASVLAGTLVRLLYRKLKIYQAAGKSPISLNRKSDFQIAISYEGSEGEGDDRRVLFDVSERLNVYNVGRLYREYEHKLAKYLELIIIDALLPIEVISADQLLDNPILPSKAE